METQELAWTRISSIGRMAKYFHLVRTILLLYFMNFYRTTQLNMPDSKRFTVWCLHAMFEVMSDRVGCQAFRCASGSMAMVLSDAI